MPGGSKYGERRYAARSVKSRIGYGKSELAKLAGVSPSWVGELAKRGSLLVHDDGSVDKASAHAYFAEELAGTGVLIPEASQRLVDEALADRTAKADAAQEAFEQTKVEVVRAYRDEGTPLRDVHAPADRGTRYDIESERARLLHYQAESLRIKAEREEGLAIGRYETEQTVGKAAHMLNEGVLSLADRLTPLVLGIEDERQVWETILRECEDLVQGFNTALLGLIEVE